jgi:integrase
MGNLLKIHVTRYVDGDGRQVPKGTPGARKVQAKSRKWYGQYLDGDGRRRREPLTTDKAAARQLLAELERAVAHGRAGLTDEFAEYRKASIREHVDAYKAHLRHKGVSEAKFKESSRQLKAVLDACDVRTLSDLRPEGVERFLNVLADRGTGVATRNTYLKVAKAFANWCVAVRRAPSNPLTALKASRGETRRQRRALSADELVRLMRATRERPLAWAETVRMGPRRGQRTAKIRPETRAAIERLGREHALIYKTLALTGLRRGELEALEVRHLTLDGPRPCLILPPRVTKNRRGANLPLHLDLAADLAAWIKATGKTPADRVFRVSRGLNQLLKRDLAWAGIPYKDERGRTVDVHALRHTTATFLGRGKVTPRVAKDFMRHHDIRLTMQTYTDPKQLDEAEALAALPHLPLDPEPAPAHKRGKAGGRER